MNSLIYTKPVRIDTSLETRLETRQDSLIIHEALEVLRKQTFNNLMSAENDYKVKLIASLRTKLIAIDEVMDKRGGHDD